MSPEDADAHFAWIASGLDGMKLSEYIAELQGLLLVCGDLPVVTTIGDGVRMIVARKPGMVTAIPAYHPHLVPGHCWETPQRWTGVPSEERVRLIKIG